MSTETTAPAFEQPAPDADPGDRPEILAAAAFAGGLISALILKRFGRDDD